MTATERKWNLNLFFFSKTKTKIIRETKQMSHGSCTFRTEFNFSYCKTASVADLLSFSLKPITKTTTITQHYCIVYRN